MRADPALRFLADCHLGRLARQLRFAGYDTLFCPEVDDQALLKIASNEERLLLTRDRELQRRGGRQALPILSSNVDEQLRELASMLDLAPGFRPFTRCMVCNRLLREVLPEKIRFKVPPKVFQTFHEFKECPGCGRIYWRGDHYRKMMERWERLLGDTKTASMQRG